MKNWFIKTFKKRHAVRVYVIQEDKRVLEFWRIPKLDTVNLNEYGAYVIDNANIHLTGKNIPTYYYNVMNTEPLPMKLVDKKTHTYLSPQKYKTALNSKAEEALLASASTAILDTQTIVIIIVMLVGFAGLGYYLSEQIAQIIELLTPAV